MGKGTEALEKIVTEAKKIQKAHPKKAWKMCVKEASQAYNKRKKK